MKILCPVDIISYDASYHAFYCIPSFCICSFYQLINIDWWPPPASRVFDFTVFLEKTTRCQLFTFLSHISLSHFHAATHMYKSNSAAFNTAYQDVFHMIRYNATNYELRRYIPQIILYWPVNQLFQIWQSLPDWSL